MARQLSVREQNAQDYLAKSEILYELSKALVEKTGFLCDGWLQSQYSYNKTMIVLAVHDILLSTPRSVIYGLINGDLPEKANDSSVRFVQTHEYAAVANTGIVMPIIYAVYLVHIHDGTPPTIAEMHEILAELPAVTPDTRDNKKATENLAAQLELRIDGCEPDAILSGGLVHIGFAGDGVTRMKNHSDGINSNEVMQAFHEAAGINFDLQSFVVGKIRKLEYAGLAEVVFSRLSQSYTCMGGGFNGKAAGTSIAGAYSINVRSWEKINALPPDPIYDTNNTNDVMKMQAATVAMRSALARDSEIREERKALAAVRMMFSDAENAKIDRSVAEALAAFNARMEEEDKANSIPDPGQFSVDGAINDAEDIDDTVESINQPEQLAEESADDIEDSQSQPIRPPSWFHRRRI